MAGAAAPARAIAATPSGGFVVAVEARVQYRDEALRPSRDEIREVPRESLLVAKPQTTSLLISEVAAAEPPVLVRPTASLVSLPVGETSFSGFGGGRVPTGLLLARDAAPYEAPTAPRADASPKPSLLRVDADGPRRFRVAARAAVDGLPRGAALVDHVACHGTRVAAASGFDATCSLATFDLDGLRPLATSVLAQTPASRSRVRGLAPRADGGLVALLQVDDKAEPPLCGIASASAAPPPADACLLDVALEAPRARSPEPSDDLAAELASLRRHVDARFDAIERKLDALLAVSKF